MYRKRRDDCLPVLTLLVRLRHEILAGAAGRPQLVLGPDAAAVVAHPLHPVFSEKQDDVRREAERQQFKSVLVTRQL